MKIDIELPKDYKMYFVGDLMVGHPCAKKLEVNKNGE